MDALEAQTLYELFGVRRWPSIAALKPFFGNNLGGSGLIETAILLMSMRSDEIPPTLNYVKPTGRFALPLSSEWEEKEIRIAIKTTAAFGGFYGAIVFAPLGH
jgi:3-oxoacyl-[acyl-carrier-protein] synthase II